MSGCVLQDSKPIDSSLQRACQIRDSQNSSYLHAIYIPHARCTFRKDRRSISRSRLSRDPIFLRTRLPKQAA